MTFTESLADQISRSSRNNMDTSQFDQRSLADQISRSSRNVSGMSVERQLEPSRSDFTVQPQRRAAQGRSKAEPSRSDFTVQPQRQIMTLNEYREPSRSDFTVQPQRSTRAFTLALQA